MSLRNRHSVHLWTACLSAMVMTLGIVAAMEAADLDITPLHLRVERQGHTATRLADGRILLIGGENAAGPVGESEIYDPSAQSLSTTASLSVPRTGHTATRLADGRVLVTGGRDESGPLASTEVFDPETRAFSLSSDLNRPRAGHGATVLEDGRILVAGGDPEGSAEIYDPGTQSFTPLEARLGMPRASQGTALLQDGRVLIAGGTGEDGSALSSAEIFDPATLSFSPTGNDLHSARSHPALHKLPDGKVQIIGGNGEGTLEVFDPAGNAFGAYAQVLNSSNTPAEVLNAQTRASLIHKGSALDPVLDEIVSRDNYSMADVPQSNEALLGGGVDGNDQALGSAYLLGSSQASVTTDRLHYAPGESVTVSGAGWQPKEPVSIASHEEPPLHEDTTLSSVTDKGGKFSLKTQASGEQDVDLTHTLTAEGLSSGFTAQTAFTSGNSSSSAGTVGGGSASGTLAQQDPNASTPTDPGQNASICCALKQAQDSATEVSTKLAVVANGNYFDGRFPGGLGGPEDYFCRTTAQRTDLNNRILGLAGYPAVNPKPTGIWVTLDHEKCVPYTVSNSYLLQNANDSTKTEVINEGKIADWYNSIKGLTGENGAAGAGIIAFMVLYDDDFDRYEPNNCIYGTPDTAAACGWTNPPTNTIRRHPPTRTTIFPLEDKNITVLVNKFKTLTNLVWIVMEEWEEEMTPGRVESIAARIKVLDPGHPVGVHALPAGNPRRVGYHSSFSNAGSPMTFFAFQADVGTLPALYSAVSAQVTLANSAATKYAVVMTDNTAPPGPLSKDVLLGGVTTTERTNLRRTGWQTMFAGAAGFLQLATFEEEKSAANPYNTATVERDPGGPLMSDWGRIHGIMNGIPSMRNFLPDDTRKFGTPAQHALANSSLKSYLVYSEACGTMGVVASAFTSGTTVKSKWYDLTDGDVITNANWTSNGTNHTWTKPASIASDCILWAFK